MWTTTYLLASSPSRLIQWVRMRLPPYLTDMIDAWEMFPKPGVANFQAAAHYRATAYSELGRTSGWPERVNVLAHTAQLVGAAGWRAFVRALACRSCKSNCVYMRRHTYSSSRTPARQLCGPVPLSLPPSRATKPQKFGATALHSLNDAEDISPWPGESVQLQASLKYSIITFLRKVIGFLFIYLINILKQLTEEKKNLKIR